MKVTGNSSTEQVLRESKVFTGLANYKILTINPTLEELQKINPNATEGQVKYTDKDEDGKDRTRIDFWVGNQKHVSKISFFIVNKTEVSRNGKTRFIDKKGNYSYADSLEAITENPKMDWMNKDSLRPAIVGESTLIDFLKAWLNVNTRDENAEIMIEKPEKIAKGDLKEIKEVYNKFKNNQVKLLAVARITDDGRIFQDFYKRFFGVPYLKSLSKWQSMLEDEYSALRDNQKLQNGLEFTEYIGDPTSIGSPASTVTPSESGGFDDMDLTF